MNRAEEFKELPIGFNIHDDAEKVVDIYITKQPDDFAKQSSEWVSVKSELPTREKGYDWVLVIAEMQPERYKGVPAVAELRRGVWYFRDFVFSAEKALGIKVTHWQPLPEPPKQVNLCYGAKPPSECKSNNVNCDFPECLEPPKH